MVPINFKFQRIFISSLSLLIFLYLFLAFDAFWIRNTQESDITLGKPNQAKIKEQDSLQLENKEISVAVKPSKEITKEADTSANKKAPVISSSQADTEQSSAVSKTTGNPKSSENIETMDISRPGNGESDYKSAVQVDIPGSKKLVRDLNPSWKFLKGKDGDRDALIHLSDACLDSDNNLFLPSSDIHVPSINVAASANEMDVTFAPRMNPSRKEDTIEEYFTEI